MIDLSGMQCYIELSTGSGLLMIGHLSSGNFHYVEES